MVKQRLLLAKQAARFKFANKGKMPAGTADQDERELNRAVNAAHDAGVQAEYARVLFRNLQAAHKIIEVLKIGINWYLFLRNI